MLLTTPQTLSWVTLITLFWKMLMEFKCDMHSWCPCTGSLSTRFVVGTSKVLYLHRFFTIVLIYISKLFSVCLWQKIDCILRSRHYIQSPSKTSLLLILFLL
jgi:hypothetical protein